MTSMSILNWLLGLSCLYVCISLNRILRLSEICLSNSKNGWNKLGFILTRKKFTYHSNQVCTLHSDSWIFCQTKPWLHNWQPVLGLMVNSRLGVFALVLFKMASSRQLSPYQTDWNLTLGVQRINVAIVGDATLWEPRNNKINSFTP